MGLLVAPSAAGAAANNNTSAKLRQAVTLQAVRAHQAEWQAIATLSGGNRFAGLPGHDLSAQYVIDELEDAGYNPTVHTFTYNAFFEVTPSELDQVSPTPATYVNGNDFRVLSYSGSGETTAALTRPTGDIRGCYAADWAGFTAGNIAIVQRGTPAGFPGGSCTFRIKMDNAIAAGASAVLVYNNVAGVLNGTLGEAGGLSAIPGLGLTQSLGESLLAQMTGGPVTMHVKTNTDSRPLETYNVLAETAGGDADNVVMAGAHLDSVSTGPGINDNGSGSGALLETAIQMSKVKPRNKVRFAWWSAEESGLVGSTRWVASLSQAEGEKIALYLNFDMVGSPNFVRFVYDGDNSTGTGTIPAGCVERCQSGSGVIESVFTGYFNSVSLPSEPTPFNGRSDYGPFIAANIPSGGLFTGAEQPKTAAQAAIYGGTAGIAYDPCYHAACDTYDNNSNTALDQMSDAIAHATITFAQSTEIVNGIKGKGNFKAPATGEGGSGAGGGGGLHDGHEDDPA
ncbi:MAG TPA: M28 family metallopeptidase [Solirubrobacteraceae bacterium]